MHPRIEPVDYLTQSYQKDQSCIMQSYGGGGSIMEFGGSETRPIIGNYSVPSLGVAKTIVYYFPLAHMIIHTHKHTHTHTHNLTHTQTHGHGHTLCSAIYHAHGHWHKQSRIICRVPFWLLSFNKLSSTTIYDELSSTTNIKHQWLLLQREITGRPVPDPVVRNKLKYG